MGSIPIHLRHFLCRRASRGNGPMWTIRPTSRSCRPAVDRRAAWPRSIYGVWFHRDPGVGRAGDEDDDRSSRWCLPRPAVGRGVFARRAAVVSGRAARRLPRSRRPSRGSIWSPTWRRNAGTDARRQRGRGGPARLRRTEADLQRQGARAVPFVSEVKGGHGVHGQEQIG